MNFNNAEKTATDDSKKLHLCGVKIWHRNLTDANYNEVIDNNFNISMNKVHQFKIDGSAKNITLTVTYAAPINIEANIHTTFIRPDILLFRMIEYPKRRYTYKFTFNIYVDERLFVRSVNIGMFKYL